MGTLLAQVPAVSSASAGLTATPPPASRGTGHERALLDGVTLDRPFGAVQTVLNNAIEHVTGYRDDRLGNGLQQVILSGTQFVQAALRHAAAGKGIVATGSSLLGKILPVAGIVSGIAQVWQGWHELDNPTSLLDIVGSCTARTGLLSIAASSLLFVPGVGSALGGAMLRIVAGANELDVFHGLDLPSHALEHGAPDIAARAHPLDRTPTNAYDRDRERARQPQPIGTNAPAIAVAP